jgi:hypothetical protein
MFRETDFLHCVHDSILKQRGTQVLVGRSIQVGIKNRVTSTPERQMRALWGPR